MLLPTVTSLYSDIQVLVVETIPIQTVESPVPHEPISESYNTIFFDMIKSDIIFLR